MDGVAALERSCQQLAKLAPNVAPDQITAATPCADWDVRAMMNHAVGAGWMFTLVNRGETVGEHAGDVIGDDLVGAIAQVSRENVDAWRQPDALEGDRTYPFGTFPAQAALMINLGEVALHAWDLAKATGQDASMDPQVASLLYGFYSQVPMDEYRAHGAFGPEVQVPASASDEDRLLGYLGRTP